MYETFLVLLVLGIFTASAVGTRIVLVMLQRYRVLDIPNARSNHGTPTPRGGGIAVVIVIIIGLLCSVLYRHQPIAPHLPLYTSMLLLAFISFCDDLRNISIRWRFSMQITAVTCGLYFSPFPALLFQGLIPPVIDILLTGLIWLWFINLYNFMDGIDGLTGSETAFIGIAVALITTATTVPVDFMYNGLIVAAAALGFLVWNWYPARIFMGDVGSVSLGYITGWLLLHLATEGFWAAAIIIPAYYLADSSLTLIRRIIRGDRFWESHSEHFYQQAVRLGRGHAEVVRTISAVNLLLAALAFLSTSSPLYAAISLTAALCVVTMLLRFLNSAPSRVHLAKE